MRDVTAAARSASGDLRGELIEAPRQEPAVADAVGTDEGDDRHAALRQAAGVCAFRAGRRVDWAAVGGTDSCRDPSRVTVAGYGVLVVACVPFPQVERRLGEQQCWPVQDVQADTRRFHSVRLLRAA
jgi:hypothetical protein